MELDFVALVVDHKPEDGWLPFYQALGHELERRGYRTGFLTISRFADKGFARSNLTSFNVHDILAELNQMNAVSYTEATAVGLEEKYGLGGLRNFYLCDQVYHYRGERHAYRKSLECIQVAEEFLRRNQVGCLLLFNGGDLIRRSLYVTAKLMNIPTIWSSRVPLPGRMSLASTELHLFDNLALAPYESLSPDAIEEASSAIEEFSRRRQMTIRRVYNLSLGINPRFPVNLARDLLRRLTVNGRKEPMPFLSTEFTLAKRKLKKLLYSRILQKPVEGEHFFFFPLHLVREAQLAVRAPHCYKQEYLVELVSRFLPAGYKLYVKEHPNHLGELPLSAILGISRLPNVRLLDPEYHSHDLIQQCAAVVTINSTAGYEAILYQRPVVCLGRPFYSRLGLTIDVLDLSELPNALREALYATPQGYDRLVSFMDALTKQSYPGTPGESDQKNVHLYCDAVEDFLRRRCEPKFEEGRKASPA